VGKLEVSVRGSWGLVGAGVTGHGGGAGFE